MAIDTKEKRWSMMASPLMMPGPPMFEPDGAIDADDRAHMLSLYAGIALSAPVAGTIPVFSQSYRQRRIA